MAEYNDHMEVTFTLNTRAVDDALRQLTKRLHNTAPLMATLAEQLYTITDESFDAQRSPDGTPWADLAPATWKYKQSGRKLYESGTLRDSLYANSSPTHAEVGVHAVNKGFEYGLSHQFGAQKRNIPARPFFPLNDDGTLMDFAEADIVETIIAHFEL